MIENYNVNIENNLKLDHKLALSHISTRLKLVLNPTPCTNESSFYKITIDTEEFPIEINSTLLCSKYEKTVTGLVIAHIDSLSNITGVISGIDSIFVGYINNKIFIGSEYQDTLSINVEVFIPSDTKNHISSIEAVNLEDVLSELYIASVEDNIINQETQTFKFYYLDKEGRSVLVESGDVITEVFSSQTSEVSNETIGLENDITINVIDPYGEPIGNSSGEIKADLSEGNLVLDINIPEEYELPVADRLLGGIKANATSSELGADYRFPVKLISTENPWGYVELPGLDAHRFEDLNNVPEEVRKVGSIIEYIGPNSADYTKGYFYQFTPTNFNADLSQSPKWQYIELAENTGQAIADYNVFVDYLITRGDFTIALDPDEEISTITDTTPFIISLNGAVLGHFEYSEIKDLFKVLINPSYQTLEQYEPCIITLTIPNNALAWKQKNVQPMVKMGSALIYKGPITWDNLQLITSPAEGDFYTVTDRANQEWFWSGTEWLYMGEIITIPEYTAGDNVDITNYVVSSKGYVLTDGTNSFAEGDKTNTFRGKATGSYSHAEGYKTTASAIEAHAEGANTYARSQAAHAEGGYTRADGQYSHAEGYQTHAIGNLSHAEGGQTNANGLYSHAEGNQTTAVYSCSHSEGELTVAIGRYSHAEGKGTKDSIGTIHNNAEDKVTFTVARFDGDISGSISDFIVGDIVECAGNCAKIESVDTSTNTVTFNRALPNAVTNDTIYTVYDGFAYGQASHSEGWNTYAEGDASHTEGTCTVATNDSEHAEGTYNVSNANTIHSIGIGTASDARANAVEVMTSGDMYLYGVGGYDGTNPLTATSLQNSLGDKNVQSDWNETNSSNDAFIKNKPSLNFLPISGGTLTGQIYQGDILGTSARVTADKKYNWVNISSGASVDFKITLPTKTENNITTAYLAGPCEVICAIKNSTGSDITINLPYNTTAVMVDDTGTAISSGTAVHNMLGEDTFTVSDGKIAEIIVTYWSATEASFNGGVEI